MSQKQVLSVSASYLAEEANAGVKGLRRGARSDSDTFKTFENPNESLSNTNESKDIVKAIWGSEDEATITKKHENWQQFREKQSEAIKRKLTIVDAIKLAVSLYLFRRAAHSFGFSARKVGFSLTLLLFLRGIFSARAPAKTYQSDDMDVYINYPIVGQIGIVYDALTKGGFNNQLEYAKKRNFQSYELVVFGKTKDIGLMDPKDREYMLKTNWRNYVKNKSDGGGFQENFAEILGRGIFAVDGDEWQDHRKVASHLFSANGLKSKMEKSFTTHGRKLVELLSAKADTNEVIDFQSAMTDLTFETICDIAFGLAPGSMEAGLIEGKKIDFLTRFDRAQQNSLLRFIIPIPIWKIMRYLNIGSERVLREDCEQLVKYVSQIIQNRTKSGDFEISDDLLSMYVKTAKASGKKYMMDENYLIDAILNFMIAGRDTTSCTLTNLFKLLPTNPGVREKMMEELDRYVGRGNPVGWDHIRDLKFCGAVFNEVLRLYPPVGGDTRFALADDVLPSGIRIKAGQQVSIPNIAIGRDPNLWNEPDKFLPERWLQEDKPTRRPDEYMFPVFWAGPRLCLGKDMARLEAISIAYAVLGRYTVQVLPHSEKMVNGPVQFYEQGLPVKLFAIHSS